MASQTAASFASSLSAAESISLFRRAQAEWARTPARRPIATPAGGEAETESDIKSLSSGGTVRIDAPTRRASRSSSFCDSVLSALSSSSSGSSGSSWETLSSAAASSFSADEEVVTTIGVAGSSAASWRSVSEGGRTLSSFSLSLSSSSFEAASSSSVASSSSASLRSAGESARAAAEAICAGLVADVADGKQRFSELEGRVEGLVVREDAERQVVAREKRQREDEERAVRVVLRGYVPVAREGGVCGREWVRGVAKGLVGEGAYPGFAA